MTSSKAASSFKLKAIQTQLNHRRLVKSPVAEWLFDVSHIGELGNFLCLLRVRRQAIIKLAAFRLSIVLWRSIKTAFSRRVVLPLGSEKRYVPFTLTSSHSPVSPFSCLLYYIQTCTTLHYKNVCSVIGKRRRTLYQSAQKTFVSPSPIHPQ